MHVSLVKRFPCARSRSNIFSSSLPWDPLLPYLSKYLRSWIFTFRLFLISSYLFFAKSNKGREYRHQQNYPKEVHLDLDDVGFNCFLLHCDWAQVITLHVCDCARRHQISCISSGIVEALFSVIYGTRHQSSLNLLHENRSREAIPTEVLLLEWFPQIVSSSPTTSHSKIVFHQSKTNLQVSIQASHKYVYV